MPKIVDHDERREVIAHAACRVVARHGLEKTTMARIARASGHSTGMLVHYFATKEDIIMAALRLILRRTEQRLTASKRSGNDLLTVLGESLPIDTQRRAECAAWTAFWAAAATDARARRLNKSLHREYVRLFERCIATHWPQWHDWPGALRIEVLMSVMTFINGITSSAVSSPADWPARRQWDLLALQLQLLQQWAAREARSAKYLSG